MSDNVDALVIFGATGDLAKLETFPALVGLVKRGVLDVPVVGVAKSGWGLDQFRDYAVASLKLNGMDPADPDAVKMLSLLRYVDGDLGDEATYKAMSDQAGPGQKILYYLEVPARCSAGLPRASRPRAGRTGTGSWWRSRSARPGQLPAAQRHDAPVLPGGEHLPGGRLARPSTRWRACCSPGSRTR